MRFTEEPRYDLYPDVGDNLTLPEPERLTVEIIRPTGWQRNEFTFTESKYEFYPDDQPLNDSGEKRAVKKFKSINTKIRFNSDYILKNCVGKIENLEVEKIVNGQSEIVKITNGKELSDCRAYGMGKIIDQICNEVIADTITDSKKKN